MRFLVNWEFAKKGLGQIEFWRNGHLRNEILQIGILPYKGRKIHYPYIEIQLVQFIEFNRKHFNPLST